jgi:hypothetical protein
MRKGGENYMKDGREFVSYWILNALFFYFLPYIFPNLWHTGNLRLTPFMASVISSFLLTVILALVMPAFLALKIKFKEDWQWTLAYLFANVLGIWLIARYADLTGIGIVSAWVAVGIGIFATLCQWGIRTLFKGK